MANVISLFNHKGGVSKTTTAFNLGWMIGRKSKRVLLVDCDPQCNLTGMVLGFEHLEDASGIEGGGSGRPLNIRDGLAPAFESKPALIEAVKGIQVPGNANLFLLPGHVGFAEYEVTLGIAQELSGSIVTLRNLPGSLRYLIDKTAQAYDIDIAIVDMSPSLGPVNQNLVATSDYFIVPMQPDYFAIMAIRSLANVLPKWKSWADTAKSLPVLREAEYPFPDVTPKFLGYVMQKYRPRGGAAPSKAFQNWIEQVEVEVAERLIPTLEKCGMLLGTDTYKRAHVQPSKPLLQMPDFNSLIARSQQHQVPVFELSDSQLAQVGTVLDNTVESMKRFQTLFDQAAESVLAMIADAESR